MDLVIGITGLPLAGKETIANELEKHLKRDGHTVSRHRFSDVLRETLDIWDIPHGRDNEQRLAIIMNAESGFHDGALPRAMKKRLMDSTDDVAILDGVRWLPDEMMLRELPVAGTKSVIIYVDASLERRYERLKKRDRSREGQTSKEEFVRQNKMKNEVDIPAIGARADITIENGTDDIEGLKSKIEKAYREKIQPLL